MKSLAVILFFLISYSIPGLSCSMYKLTENGKTIVGNNEDWISPNHKFWYEPGSEKDYGVMYMGGLNNFAQGGINEAGLVFDGFANPYLEIKNLESKSFVPIPWAVQHVMKNYDNVQQVHDYLAGINLAALASSMLVFVDQTGEYLIVEGDELIIGDEDDKIFSNFYYSQVDRVEDVELQNVKNGLEYLKTGKSNVSFDYCGSVMKSLSSVNNTTQYSTIYDLDRLVVRVYLYHDYNTYVEIDLKQELLKGEHHTMIVDLFPESVKGREYFSEYNNQADPTAYLQEWVNPANKTEKEIVQSGFGFTLNWIGYEWLMDKNDPISAIKVFKFATELMPNNANLYDSLGEAYHKNGEILLSLENYERSIALDPKNKNAIDMVKKIKKEMSN